ncbi:cyclin-P4-1-like [Zingiber officinale]|uniref:Cyclin n=1 Tax=Zingiber officinale TaxID=94328 RepID=A0A8J5GVH5_ZINOF|nr:cyclin-P4-1-like [Zingiber officinale]KAG6507043.1 hypothetical protein ZIOFF_032383 [Zingiber officinale]
MEEEEVEEDSQAVPSMVLVLSSLLERVVERNDAAVAVGLRPLPDRTAAFHSVRKPDISARCYLERIFRYANCSPSCYAVAYIYLLRFLHRHPAVALHSLNLHRFLIAAVLAAVKFTEDIHYNNAYFAKLGGISLIEMNYLEVDFLFGLGFELNVTPATFSSYCSILQREFYLESPPLSKLHCYITEEESNCCQQKHSASSQQVFLGI